MGCSKHSRNSSELTRGCSKMQACW
jgi:hypothetical protein